MNNMIQDEKTLEELVKEADSFRKFFADLADEISKVLADIKAPKEEDTWEMKCPYEYGDNHYCVQSSGDVFSDCWHGIEADDEYFSQGNIFPTKEAAELEAKRRNLLTRFKAFRDECNVNWKVDWESNNDRKHYILFSSKGKLETYSTGVCNDFQLFGFFKNKEDAERAIELFGDEIKELFVDCEAQ